MRSPVGGCVENHDMRALGLMFPDDLTAWSIGDQYMLFASARTTWPGAVSVCSAIGGSHLASSTDAAEDALLNALAGAEDTWLGGSDIAIENQFAWESGEPMVFTNWGEGEPNDADGEDCLIVRRVGDPQNPEHNVGTWDDRDCASIYPFICERD